MADPALVGMAWAEGWAEVCEPRQGPADSFRLNARKSRNVGIGPDWPEPAH
jgi:hypothetical protein